MHHRTPYLRVRLPAFRTPIAAVVLCALTAPAMAQQPSVELSLRGFGTLGVAHNDNQGAGYIRNITQPTGIKGNHSGKLDSRLGVQLDVTLPHNLAATIQAVSRYRYDGRYTPDLAWAFVKYHPSDFVELRVGRLGWDVYMLADSRDVGYSYLWVRPPVDYYGALQFSKMNGADLVAQVPVGDDILSAKIFAGRAVGRLGVDLDSYSDAHKTSLLGGYLNYEHRHWQFRLGYTHVQVNTKVSDKQGELAKQLQQLGALGDFVRSTNRGNVEFMTAGTTYHRGPLQGQLMFTYSANRQAAAPDWRSGYGSLGYRLGQWTPFVSYATNKAGRLPTPPSLPPGTSLTAGQTVALQRFLGAANPNQSTLSAGVRYDFRATMALKFQYDHVNVRADGRRLVLWRDIAANWNGRAHVFSATLDFLF